MNAILTNGSLMLQVWKMTTHTSLNKMAFWTEHFIRVTLNNAVPPAENDDKAFLVFLKSAENPK